MVEMMEPKKHRAGGIRAALLALIILLVPLLAVDRAEAKYANAGSDTCSIAGCHPTTADLAGSAPTITVAVENVTKGTGSVLYTGTPIAADAGDILEIDWKYTGLGESGLSNHPIWLPSGWVPSKGTINTPAVTGWNSVWDAVGGIAVGNPDPWRSTHGGQTWPKSTGSTTSPDGYWVDYTGSGWDATGLADDSGAAADQDATASTMGTDMRVTVPAGATTGTYTIHVFGSGKGLDSSKNAKVNKGSIEQQISIDVTGGGGDTTPPNVSTTIPTNGATGVALDSNVTINWDENIDCATVNTTNITSDSPGWTLSTCSGSQAIFTTLGQANSTTYNVNVTTAVTDVAGNPMSAAYPFSYTTAAAVDTTPPNVSTTIPTNGATGVALDGNVTINWDENIDCATVNTTNITSDSPGWTLSTCSGSQAIFTTLGQANSTTYNVNVTTAVTDVAGNPMSAAYPFSYTTAAAVDTTPPSVSSTVPTNGATGVALDGNVTINWDENIDCATVNTTNITSDSPGWTLSTCSGSQAIFTTLGQANSTTYNVNVTTAVTDVAGNPMSAAYPFSYTTVAPAATNTTAAGTASASPGNAVIDVTAPYTDDDNGNNTVTFEVDVQGGTWSGGSYQSSTKVHAASPYTHQFTGLTNGQPYQVRVTYNDVDGVTGTSPQVISNVTPIATNPLLHNSINTESGKWSATGGWGITGAKYGEFTCATCHTRSTTNIKRFKESISTPDGTNWGGPGTPSVSVTFLSAVDGSSDFGDDSTTHVSSTKVCEVCHSYDATQAQGVKQHAYNMSVTANHYNNKDCTACHKHNQGFMANSDCNGCHGYPPDPGDGFAYLATEGKGAHLKHTNHFAALAGVTLDPTVDQFGDATVTAVCGVCHDMGGTAHETGGGTRNINFNGSTAYQFGVSAPNYNGVQGSPSSTTPKTCSSVSCHFKTTPVWE